MSVWRPCLTCGELFASIRSAGTWRVREYCSEKCRRKGVDPAWRTCEKCGSSYQTTKHRARIGEGLRYCSRQCAYADIGAWHRDLVNGVSAAALDRLNGLFDVLYECAYCGRSTDGYSNKTDRRYPQKVIRCADCDNTHKKWQAQHREMRDSYMSGGRKYVCAECGSDCVAYYGDYSSKSRRFCSNACANRYGSRQAKHVRRSRKVGGEPVGLNYLMKRDKGRCKLCGITVRRYSDERAWSADDQATTDHIVPLSAGGEHTKRNCQLVCRRCNYEKGDKSMGSQLLLVG